MAEMRTPQQQRILQGSFEMAVRTLDRAVLVCDARIVARWCHAVVAHQCGVALVGWRRAAWPDRHSTVADDHGRSSVRQY